MITELSQSLTIHGIDPQHAPCCSVTGCYAPARHTEHGVLCDNHRRKVEHRKKRSWDDPYHNLGQLAPGRRDDKLFSIRLFSSQDKENSKIIGTIVIKSCSKNSASRRLNRMFPQFRGIPRTIKPADTVYCQLPGFEADSNTIRYSDEITDDLKISVATWATMFPEIVSQL